MHTYTKEQIEKACDRAREIEYEAHERDRIIGGDTKHMVVLYNALTEARDELDSLRTLQKNTAEYLEEAREYIKAVLNIR